MRRYGYGFLHAAAASLFFISLAGCPQVLLTPLVLIRGTDIPAQCDALEERKIVVVCRAADSLLYGEDPEVATELATRVGRLLAKNGRKIEVINQSEVASWIDEQQDNWQEFTEVGEGVGADVVVGVDLNSFELKRGQTLYQGRADVKVAVRDVQDEGEVLYQPDIPTVVFPPNSPVESSLKDKRSFRRQFIQVLAEKIASHFYAHDRTAGFATDSTVLRR